MRITRFLDETRQPRVGIDQGDTTARLLDDNWQPGDAVALTGRTARIVTRLAPVEPANIFCIGLNYRDHANETGAALPEQPVVFMKPTSSVAHPGQAIGIPACCTHGDEVDYEAELAVVIGRQGRNISQDQALEHVAGYTCANDVSARRWQKHSGGGQWVRGKSFDTFCPLGPVLVTADEIPDPQTLAVTSTINGRRMQSGHTGDMIFSVAQLIAFLSQDTTLLPGTVILTGTPAGVGVARKPPVFLQPGDKVVIEIDKIGQLENPVKGIATDERG